MTQKQVENLGFVVTGKVVNGSSPRIYHPATETEFKAADLKRMTANEFINLFWDIAYKEGTAYGKIEKISEIRNALSISTTDLLTF